MSDEALEPCPWCGGVPHKAMVEDDNFYFIACPNDAGCPIHPTTIGFHLAPDKAIAAWNGGVLRERLKAAEKQLTIDRACLSGDGGLTTQIKLWRQRAEAAEARVKELDELTRIQHTALMKQNDRLIEANKRAEDAEARERAAYFRGAQDWHEHHECGVEDLWNEYKADRQREEP